MRKRFMAVILCLALAGGMLSGCGDGNRAPGTGENTEGVGAGGEVSPAGPTEKLVEDPAEGSVETTDAVELLHPYVSEYRLSGYGEDYRLLMEETYGEVGLNPEETARWRKLAETLRAEGEVAKTGAEAEFADYYRDAKEFYEVMTYDDTSYFTCTTRLQVVRADTAALSVRENYSDYLGGAHGYYASYGRNYDTESGARLTLEDVVTDMEKLPELLYEKLLALSDAEDFLDSESLLNTLKESSGEELYSWLIGYDGVTFYFNPYSIAAYAAGSFTVKLLFEEFPDLFVEKYRHAPDHYTELMSPDTPVYADLDGDGRKEEIQYYHEWNYDYGGIETVVVSAGGRTDSIGTYCYDMDVYLVHAGDRNYLYSFYRSDNDFQGLEAYALTAEGTRKTGDGMGGHLAVFYSDDGYRDREESVYYHEKSAEAFTDPLCFGLRSQIYPLGAIFGYRQYHVGQEGSPESDTPYFDLSGEWKKKWTENGEEKKTLTALQDLEMQVLQSDFTNSGESITVTAGSVLEVYRTDGESYVDFLAEDGRYLRAPITAEGWPYTISGIPMEEALDGIIYAG